MTEEVPWPAGVPTCGELESDECNDRYFALLAEVERLEKKLAVAEAIIDAQEGSPMLFRDVLIRAAKATGPPPESNALGEYLGKEKTWKEEAMTDRRKDDE